MTTKPPPIKPRDRDAIISALRAGVVPRIGLQHIQVGRQREIEALIQDIERIDNGGSSIWPEACGYYEFAQFRPSVPFIADDIMQTFDHVRSEEVFRLFGEMARAGQVIYLTHHQHLCEIAKAVVPSVAIHELG